MENTQNALIERISKVTENIVISENYSEDEKLAFIDGSKEALRMIIEELIVFFAETSKDCETPTPNETQTIYHDEEDFTDWSEIVTSEEMDEELEPETEV